MSSRHDSRRRSGERAERPRSRSQHKTRRTTDGGDERQLRAISTPARARGGDRRRSRSGSRNRSRDRSRDRSSRVVLTARDSGRDHAEGQKGERGKGSGKGFGGHRHGVLTPLPRPGVDEDERLQKLADDPRYFEGAELGKAQKAALGVTGLTGRNTASFEPASTLVRPAMRVFYGAPGKRYEQPLKGDDVIVVPNFFCAEDDFDKYDSIAEEAKTLDTDQLDLSKLPICEKGIKKMCKYFSIGEEHRGVRLTWYRNASDENPLVCDTGKFKARPSSKHQNCTVSLTLGATREHAFRRTKTEELLFMPNLNGGLTFLGEDVCRRWQYGMNMTASKEELGTSAQGRGHISITIMGHSTGLVGETLLKPSPSDEKRTAEELDGRLDVPCTGVPRPGMRIITVPPRKSFGRPVRHDDVIIVPEFCCAEDDWEIYYTLLKEMRDSQAGGARRAEWISWHEGAHLLSQNPTGSKTYQQIIDKTADYFSVAADNRGTRFNWYRDGSDWKPFHHDSAAFNEQRARTQNATIGISFGGARELAFRHAKTGELLYMPQKNGMLFYFGRDVNIVWQHGINALPESEQDGKGRISLVLWGLCTTAIEEDGSPPMLTDDSRDGKGKSKGKGKGGKGGYSMHGSGGGGGGPCRDFARGNCSYGDRCRFSHDRK